MKINSDMEDNGRLVRCMGSEDEWRPGMRASYSQSAGHDEALAYSDLVSSLYTRAWVVVERKCQS